MLDLKIDLYKKVYLIRKAEEMIKQHYFEDEMKTPMHMSLGEEAIAAGVCEALKPTDQIMGTFRSHAIYLAKTGETDKFFAELYGKVTGMGKGKSGSMHLSAPDYGFIGASSIVASSIPVAVGAAFANQQGKNGKISVAFFGDGAVEEGVFWESLNVACLMKLPVLFVCEDNGLAVHASFSQRKGYNSILDLVSAYNCHVFTQDSTDAEDVYEVAAEAVRCIKENNKPAFLHVKYYRYLEHVGVSEDFDAGYRSKQEFDTWFQRDPVKLFRRKLLTIMDEADVQQLERSIEKQIENSWQRAKEAPFPQELELSEDVYA